MKTIMRFIVLVVFWEAIAFLLLGLLNRYHPLFDSVSHFRIQAAYFLAIVTFVLIFSYRGLYRYILIVLFIVVATYTYYITRPFHGNAIYKQMPSNGTTIKHMQYNMNFRNKKLDDVIGFIKREKPDIITLQEVTDAHKRKLSSLESLYPYQRYCAFYPVVGGVAILSQYPFGKESYICAEGKGLLVSDVNINGQDLTVASLHLHWPYPYDQYSQVDELMPYLQAMNKSSLIAGDFNAATWSHIVNKIAEASHTNVTDGLRWSIELEHQLPLFPYIKLPIDQVLTSNTMSVKQIEAREHLGSDHYPIMSLVKLKTR